MLLQPSDNIIHQNLRAAGGDVIQFADSVIYCMAQTQAWRESTTISAASHVQLSIWSSVQRCAAYQIRDLTANCWRRPADAGSELANGGPTPCLPVHHVLLSLQQLEVCELSGETCTKLDILRRKKESNGFIAQYG